MTSRPAPALAVTVGPAGLQVGVRVSPAAPRTRLAGVYGDRLKVAVSAPPEDNRANSELVDALAAWLGLRRDNVRIESGHTSRDKVVSFTGIDEAELRNRLAGALMSRRP
jgi:uncharacterized protein (TIGR00251 family)